jgi:2'-deoxynucleoside 5'-phosphate N-hydrolase
MRVYFTASIVGKKQYLSSYEKIIDLLRFKKCDTISDHIIKSNESQVRMETRGQRIAFQEKLNDWINSCDCMIAETSFPSISVGYEISLALSRGKPVLILYSDGNPPSLLAQHADEKLICEKYTTNNLKTLIDDFLNFVKGKEDQRFTFYITTEIASFLEDVSKKEMLPKAVFLRRLIQKEMKLRKQTSG